MNITKHKGLDIVTPWCFERDPKEANFAAFKWTPEPFFAAITDNGITEHPDIANPKALVLFATYIPDVLFKRHVRYYLTPNKTTRNIWETFSYAGTTVYLVNDPRNGNDIYVIPQWQNMPFVVGKMFKTCPFYKKTIKAFSKLVK